MPYAFWQQFSPDQIKIFALRNALYGIHTQELVGWLKERIEPSSTIEIGAGNGVLSKALGVRAVDNYQQVMPMIKKAYDMAQQPVISYGDNVLKVDANKAVKKLEPKTIVGSWITERYDERYHSYGGNMLGPIQADLMKHARTYYMIGNKAVHDNPKFQKLVTQVHELPFLVSRAHEPELNVVFECRA